MENDCKTTRPARRECKKRPCCRGHWGNTAIRRVCTAVCVCLVCAADVWAETPTPPQPEVKENANEVVTPPKVVTSVLAQYPPEELRARQQATVVLLVTVDASGDVEQVAVAESANTNFDAAALAAIKQWRFEPARRGDTAVASRIRVPFRFSLPENTLPESASSEGKNNELPAPSIASTHDESVDTNETPIEVTVQGQRRARTENRSSADFEISREILASAPRLEGADVLRAAPGVYIGRSEGAAVAHSYMLRGFDAEHGQDIEFRVGGLPVNIPSHLHGQGYSDLSFLIGDVVRTLSVTEGVYDPKQGDFAVAGSIDIALGVEKRDRGVWFRSGYGAFGTNQLRMVWAPEDGTEDSFGAVQYANTEGFGENRASESSSAIVQHRFGTGELTYRAIAIAHAARANHAGVVRQDDIDAGRICFTCVYPFATAQAQNALANRILAGLFADYHNDKGANGQVGIWFGYDNFRIQQNFTGFIEASRTLERVAGRGDLIEQLNRTASFGLTGRYRTAPLRPFAWTHGTFELGMDARMDIIGQTQNLLDAAVRNQTWDRRVDAGIRSTDLGFWSDSEWHLGRYVRARLGFRADVLSYDIEDRLGNFAPLTRPDDQFIVGFRRSALGTAWGPRTSVELKPLPWLSFLAAYGEGYRSPQARTLEDGERAPFTKVRSADIGLRFDWGEQLQVTVGGYATRLSDDIAFEAGEGRLERIGATRRMGAVIHALAKPADWLTGALSLTYVDAILLEPPPATAEEPDPPFEKGQNLPFVPPLVVRADLGAKRSLWSIGDKPLVGNTGLGFSLLSPRPLQFGGKADTLALLDASAGVTWGPVTLSVEVFNLLNAEYAASEFNFASDWDPNDGVRPRTPQRHIAAGAPRSWLVSLEGRL